MKQIIDIFLPYQKKFFESNKRFKLWISARQIGKSFTLAGLLTYRALARKNGLSLCISTGARAASEIIVKCRLFAEAVKQLSKGAIDYTTGYDHITFNNGCRIMSLPSSTDGANLRGWSAQCVVIDEACYIPHLESIMNSITPTLTRDPSSELIIATTPAGMNNYVYKMVQEADDNWYIQYTTIQDAIDAGLKVDIEQLKKLCPDEEAFNREYMCCWSNEMSDFIDTSILRFTDNIGDGYYVFGMDIGRKNDKTAITVGKVNYDKLIIEDIVVLDKMSYAEQKHKLAELKNQYKFIGGYIDQGGIGNAFAEDVNTNIDVRYKGYTFTGSNKTPLYEALRAKVFDTKIEFNTKLKDVLIEDFNNIHRVVKEDGSVQFIAGRNKSGHADISSSLVLCVQASKDFKQNNMMPVQIGSFNTAFGNRNSWLRTF